MAAEGDEVQVSLLLPMDLDISWEEDEFLHELPDMVPEKCHQLNMSTLDVDFGKLTSRTESTSTPFVPRATMCKSPITTANSMFHASINITQDSGYDAESSIMSDPSLHSVEGIEKEISPIGFIPIQTAERRQRQSRRSFDDDVFQLETCFETDSAYDETSSICSIQSQTLSDVSTSSDSQAMDIVFQALDLNSSSGYSSIDSSRYCSQHDLTSTEPESEDKPMSSESESSRESQVSVVEMVCVKLEKALPMFSKAIGDRLIGRKMGLNQLDVIEELHMRGMTTPLSVVFSYLSPKDLTSVSCVSRVWRESVLDDSHSRLRKQLFIQQQRIPQAQKENVCVWKRSETKSRTDRGVIRRREEPLAELLQNVSTKLSIFSPCSDKHEQFLEEAGKLTNDESLRKCPQCQHPARVDRVQERAKCSNSKCSYDFCIGCLSPYHGSKDCNSLGPATSKKSRTESKIGSKKSKRNLRRL